MEFNRPGQLIDFVLRKCNDIDYSIHDDNDIVIHENFDPKYIDMCIKLLEEKFNFMVNRIISLQRENLEVFFTEDMRLLTTDNLWFAEVDSNMILPDTIDVIYIKSDYGWNKNINSEDSKFSVIIIDGKRFEYRNLYPLMNSSWYKFKKI